MIPLRGNVRSRSLPVVNLVLIVADLTGFLYERSLSPPELEHLLGEHALVPRSPTWGLIHRPLDPCRTLLPDVEGRLGQRLYLGFYLVAGIVASLAQRVSDPRSTVPAIGTSGAVAGGERTSGYRRGGSGADPSSICSRRGRRR